MRTKPVRTSANLLYVALAAAHAAGRVHLRRLNRVNVKRKANALDLVTEADQESERAIIRKLKRTFPDHAILAEESGASSRQSEHRWIIDPLDGTTNFAHGFPQFCVSIAYECRGRLELGVVFDALKHELFFAVRGRGARLNGRPIHVSATASLDRALLATSLPYDQRERRNFYLGFWEAFMMRTEGVRHAGSAVLDLCYAVCGRVDGLWNFGLRPWDIAAGALIVTEAGGRVTNLEGGALDLGGRHIMATNRKLQRAMRETIMKAWPEAVLREVEGGAAP
jgi:myo-inositol-1(or 4)-monophosphatase